MVTPFSSFLPCSLWSYHVSPQISGRDTPFLFTSLMLNKYRWKCSTSSNGRLQSRHSVVIPLRCNHVKLLHIVWTWGWEWAAFLRPRTETWEAPQRWRSTTKVLYEASVVEVAVIFKTRSLQLQAACGLGWPTDTACWRENSNILREVKKHRKSCHTDCKKPHEFY